MDGLLFKIKFNEMKLAAFITVMCLALLICAYAATNYLWAAPVTVTILTSSPYIKVYYGNQEVTAINFGNLVPGTSIGITLYIKNTHPNATFYDIYWGSTLSDITNKITDAWTLALGWPVDIGPGGTIGTTYRITVASDCPIGTYQWTLYLYGPG